MTLLNDSKTWRMPKLATCSACGQAWARCGESSSLDGGESDCDCWHTDICHPCARRLPPSLIKACSDEFMYALKLTTGDVIRFTSAEVHGEYAHLTPSGWSNGRGEAAFTDCDFPFIAPRGIDVRLDQIVWCIDAPDGS